jgi:hypothetical protein
MRMRERNMKFLLMCGLQAGMPKRKTGGNTVFAFSVNSVINRVKRHVRMRGAPVVRLISGHQGDIRDSLAISRRQRGGGVD